MDVRMFKARVKKISPEYFIDRVRAFKIITLKWRYKLNICDSLECEWLGNDYSGHILVKNILNSNSIVYSIGVGEETTFEEQLARRYDCYINFIDPTPRSITFYKTTKTIFGNIERKQVDLSLENKVEVCVDYFTRNKTKLLPVACWNQDSYVEMFEPAKSTDVSYSILNMQNTNNKIKAIGLKFESIVSTFKDKLNLIDIIKMNIEGAEYEVLKNILSTSCRPKLLLVAYDELHTQIDKNSDRRIKESIDFVINKGYQIFYIDLSRIGFCRADLLKG